MSPEQKELAEEITKMLFDRFKANQQELINQVIDDFMDTPMQCSNAGSPIDFNIPVPVLKIDTSGIKL